MAEEKTAQDLLLETSAWHPRVHSVLIEPSRALRREFRHSARLCGDILVREILPVRKQNPGHAAAIGHLDTFGNSTGI